MEGKGICLRIFRRIRGRVLPRPIRPLEWQVLPDILPRSLLACCGLLTELASLTNLGWSDV